MRDSPRGPDQPDERPGEPDDNGDQPNQQPDQPAEGDQPRENDQPTEAEQRDGWGKFELAESDMDTELAAQEKLLLREEGYDEALLDELYGSDQELGLADGHDHTPGPDVWTGTDAQRPDHDPENHAWTPAAKRIEWQEPLTRGDVDQVGLGIVDERARAFEPHERRTADSLAREGAAVIALFEDHSAKHAKNTDALVDGVPTEFKSVDPGASDATVKSALKYAKDQARHTIIDARDSGLPEADAHRGIRRFLGTPEAHATDTIRIIADDYDVTWKRDT